jgi:hypothetical protein
MMGMRRGFKKAATSVVGSDTKARPQSRTRAWVGNALTALIIIAVIAFLFYRWR